MKRILANGLLALIAAACITTPLYGCGSSASSGNSSQDEQASIAEPAQTTDQAENTDESEGQPAPATDSPYVVSIDNARVTTDYDGNPAVVITYTFTNNSDETQSFATACNETVYQNGVECSMGFGTDYESGGYMQKVKPGATSSCELLYNLQDTTSPVDVEVGELFSFGDELLAQKTFTLQ